MCYTRTYPTFLSGMNTLFQLAANRKTSSSATISFTLDANIVLLAVLSTEAVHVLFYHGSTLLHPTELKLTKALLSAVKFAVSIENEKKAATQCFTFFALVLPTNCTFSMWWPKCGPSKTVPPLVETHGNAAKQAAENGSYGTSTMAEKASTQFQGIPCFVSGHRRHGKSPFTTLRLRT